MRGSIAFWGPGVAILAAGWLCLRAAPASGQDAGNQAPAGARDFEMRALYLRDEIWVCVRFRKDNGETWAIVDQKWHRVKEPQRPAAGEYDVAAVRFKDGANLFRVERRSGASWVAFEGKWEPIPEGDNPLPAGDYALSAVAGDKGVYLFRIDRRTGAGWQVRDKRWSRVADPD